MVVPTLGTRADWLRLSLSALQNQAPPVNVVLVGPDNAIIRDMAIEFGATLLTEKGRTLSAAINQGVRENPKPTPFIGWIADDDVIAPNSIARSVRALENDPQAPFAFGRLRYIDALGRSMWLIRPGSWSVPYAHYGRNFIPQPGSIQRLSAWQAVGGLDEKLSNAMDLDLFLKLAKLGKPVYIPQEVAAFRVHDGSISVVKLGKSGASEAADVSRQYRKTNRMDRLIDTAIAVSDRVLLSVHRRIPGPAAAQVAGNPYHVLRGQALDDSQ